MMEIIKGVGELAMMAVMIMVTIKAYKLMKHVQFRVTRLLDKYDRISELMDRNAHQDVFLAKFSSKSKERYRVLS